MNVVSQSSQPSASAIYRPTYPRKKARVSKASKKTYTKVTKGSLALTVRKELDKMAEVKQVAYTWNQIGSSGLANYSTGSGVWGVTNVIPFYPNAGYMTIGQGTGQGNRIGNSVRTHSLIYQGVLYPNQYNATYNPTPIPQEVMFLLLSRKDTGDSLLNSITALFQTGSTSVNPDGTLMDIVRDFNLDLWNVHYKRVFKVGAAENTGTGAVAGFQNYASNDFKYNCKFKMDLTKYIDKVIKFNDATNTSTATHNYLYGMWFTCDADGTGSTHIPTCLTSNLIYKFIDV